MAEKRMAKYEFIACYMMASQRNGTIYTGVTSDLMTRVLEHRDGSGSAFTARYGCGLLVWWEQFGDMAAAIAREKDVKSLRRAWKLRLIERTNPEWRDLYEDFLLPPGAAPFEDQLRRARNET
jgi:putative endonuclease